MVKRQLVATGSMGCLDLLRFLVADLLSWLQLGWDQLLRLSETARGEQWDRAARMDTSKKFSMGYSTWLVSCWMVVNDSLRYGGSIPGGFSRTQPEWGGKLWLGLTRMGINQNGQDMVGKTSHTHPRRGGWTMQQGISVWILEVHSGYMFLTRTHSNRLAAHVKACRLIVAKISFACAHSRASNNVLWYNGLVINNT